MINKETMQLDLFHGVVLTAKQQEEIDNFIKKQAKRAVKSQEDVNKTMLLLDEAGFVQGVDYNSDFEVYEVTKKREFGYSYNNTNFEYEVTYMHFEGGVHLIVDTIKGLYNVALLKFTMMVLFTLLLNILCQRGLGVISWIIVFIPFNCL